jgi:hypothetical protein
LSRSGHSSPTAGSAPSAERRGDADALERFKQTQPGARVEIVDSGHDVLEDAPEETVRLVGEFLG